MASAGDVIADRFVLQRIAGRGGMGVVWRARDTTDDAAVAVKLLFWPDAQSRERFEREGRLLAELGHPGIVRHVAHGQTEGGVSYIAMEWLDGEDLAARMTRAPLSLHEAVDVARRVAEALGAAHARGIVHRDVKPSNVLLVEGDPRRVKLLDFGVASLGSAWTVTTATGILGTPSFMSPEQVQRAHAVDARADVFSLGCVLYKALTGRVPFAGESAAAIITKILLEEPAPIAAARDDLPEALAQLVHRMLSKDPTTRPADGAAVAAELHALGLYAPRSIRAIGSGERRVVSVILLRHEGDDLDAARSTAAQFGASITALAGGLVVACVDEAGEARDRVARAAACAMALRAVLGAPASLATGTSAAAGTRAAVGEPIERATQLLRPGDGVWIDDVTAGLLDARFDVVRTGDPPALLLRGERDTLEAGRTILGRPSPCVGRDRELAMLAATFAQCRDESVARLVLVTAPGGMGKSRLRRELVERLRAHGRPIEVLSARGDSMSGGGAYGLLARAVRAAADVLGGEPRDVGRRKLFERVGRHLRGVDAVRTAKRLAEMIGVPRGEGEGEGDDGDDGERDDDDVSSLRAARADPVLRGDQMRAAFERFIEAECDTQPVLLILDDLQWGDRPSVDLVDRLLQNLRERPLMVLALARPEVHDVFSGLWSERGGDELRLGRLTRSASERLVRGVLGDGVGEATMARLVERAEGNPLSLEELCRAVAEGREDTLPGTVLATVQARLSALDGGARRILRAASVFGRAFWRGGVGALLGGEDPAEWLDGLVRREIVVRAAHARFAGETEYVFRHEVVRDAAYGMLTEADRALGHRLAALWLDERGETEALALAEHFERGELPGRAVLWYGRAAEQALAGNDFASAVERADRAVTCGARGAALGALRLVQAEASRWTGKWADSEARALEAVAALPEGEAAWYAAVAEADLASLVLGHTEERAAFVSRVQQPASGEPAERARLLSCARIAMSLLVVGRIDLAGPLTDAIAPYADSPDGQLRGRVLRALATRAQIAGDAATYVEHLEAAAAGFDQAGDARNACMTRISVGYGFAELGENARAEAALRAALAQAERARLEGSVTDAKHNLGLVLARIGRLAEGARLEREACDAFARQGNRPQEGGSHVYLSLALAMAGDYAGAESSARHAVDCLAAVPPLRCHALAALSRALLGAKRADEAMTVAQEAMDLMGRLGGIENDSRVRLSYAEALLASGRTDDAREAVSDARESILARAARIAREDWRASFLERVPENARILQLAGEAAAPQTP
jgi:hypothetical protein